MVFLRLVEIKIELESRLHFVDLYDDVGMINNCVCILYREPKWNKTVNCMTMPGTKFIDVEIYDECTFSTGIVQSIMYLLLWCVMSVEYSLLYSKYSLLCSVF